MPKHYISTYHLEGFAEGQNAARVIALADSEADAVARTRDFLADYHGLGQDEMTWVETRPAYDADFVGFRPAKFWRGVWF